MIEMLWPTPVLRQLSHWSQQEMQDLKAFAMERFAHHKANPLDHGLPDVDVKLRLQLNLFHQVQGLPACRTRCSKCGRTAGRGEVHSCLLSARHAGATSLPPHL
jgi:hypothetical protein